MYAPKLAYGSVCTYQFVTVCIYAIRRRLRQNNKFILIDDDAVAYPDKKFKYFCDQWVAYTVINAQVVTCGLVVYGDKGDEIF